VAKVALRGLKIARARGKYYVYDRVSGEALLRGFAGTKAELLKRLGEPDTLGAYNIRRRRPLESYPEKTLGWLVAWFTDPEQCPEFKILSETTRSEYTDRLTYLEPEFDFPLKDITQAGLYEVRDRCVKDKWPAFADKMLTALSSMFTAATKRGKMTSNPAIGIDRISKPDPNANREWRPEEWSAVWEHASLKFRIVFMLARHIGYRGQSLVKLQWSNYRSDPDYGKCFRAIHRKNSEQHWVPASQALQSFLDGLERTSTYIATRHNGQPWRDEEQLQKQVSNFLTGMARKGLVGDGLTLHGLRVTYAAGIKRAAAKRKGSVSNAAIAAALGDRDERMGAHYTRHVENEINVVQAFPKPKRQKKK
jgi:integrase